MNAIYYPDMQSRTVAALAGRRIDGPDAPRVQFPLERLPQVRKALAEVFAAERVGMLVCSAACGADLAALDVAHRAGIRCRVVLPFEAKRFRETSVIDRPGDWGPLYDRLIAQIEVITLEEAGEPNRAYQMANERIVAEAQRNGGSLAIVVWEGRPRDDADATAQFRKLALAAGMTERFIATS
jgi:hypothetical protein